MLQNYIKYTKRVEDKSTQDSAFELAQMDHKDGSKTNEGTGAEVAESMGIFPSIFQADVYTIERCVENKSGQVLQWSIHCNLVR